MVVISHYCLRTSKSDSWFLFDSNKHKNFGCILSQTFSLNFFQDPVYTFSFDCNTIQHQILRVQNFFSHFESLGPIIIEI